MMWNAFVTSYRFIIKSRTYTILNLAGLVAGLAAAYILLLFAFNQISYDRFHARADRIYRVINRDTKGSKYMLTPYLLSPHLQEITQDVEASARVVFLLYFTGTVAVQKDGVFTNEPRFLCADQEILDILSFYLKKGKITDCLEGPAPVILSESTARSYFGTDDVVGRSLIIKAGGTPDTLRVTGVYEDIPWNSSLRADFIAGMPVLDRIMKRFSMNPSVDFRNLDDPTVETFVLLKSGGAVPDVMKNLAEQFRSEGLKVSSSSFIFQNIKNIFLGSEDVTDDMHTHGNRTSLYVYASLAIFILFLAGINYSILSTARSALRFKEVGVRKVLGASRGALRGQVLTESVLLTFMAFLIAFLLVGLAEPFMQHLFGYTVHIYSLETLVYIPLFAAIAVFIGLLSGAYLSFYLSSLNPVQALRNKLLAYRKISLSRVFTVFQLLITMALFMAVVTIYLQLDFCINSDQGFDQRNLLTVSFDPKDFHSYHALKDAIKSDPNVMAVSGGSFFAPDKAFSTFILKWDRSDSSATLETFSIDAGFFRAMGIRVIAGSEFSERDSATNSSALIVNEEAMREIGVRQMIRISTGLKRNLQAVVADFNIHSLYTRINPTLFFYNPSAVKVMMVRFKPGTERKVLASVRENWNRLAPTLPLNYRVYTGELYSMYRKERTLGQVVAGFTVLAFIIMGMGLFGLALLISERKVKETAIRKVFGASGTDILLFMQKEFLGYILVAAAIAVPLMWFVMNRWLDTFYYRISLHWWIYVMAVLSITIFVSSIIFVRTYRMLNLNPANALRYE
jgi:putative ABC transport system permease protein